MTIRYHLILLFILCIALNANVSAETFDTPAVTAEKITTKQLLNPDWMEQRLKEVGIEKLIAEYSQRKEPDVLIVRDALLLSQSIVEKHPEVLRNQLQGRLVFLQASCAEVISNIACQ